MFPDVSLLAGQLVTDDAVEATLVPAGGTLAVVEDSPVHQPGVSILKIKGQIVRQIEIDKYICKDTCSNIKDACRCRGQNCPSTRCVRSENKRTNKDRYKDN